MKDLLFGSRADHDLSCLRCVVECSVFYLQFLQADVLLRVAFYQIVSAFFFWPFMFPCHFNFYPFIPPLSFMPFRRFIPANHFCAVTPASLRPLFPRASPSPELLAPFTHCHSPLRLRLHRPSIPKVLRYRLVAPLFTSRIVLSRASFCLTFKRCLFCPFWAFTRRFLS